MSICRWRNAIVLAVILTACGRDEIVLNNFDAQRWRKDGNACMKDRAALFENLLNQKSALLGHDEIDIVEVLGKPDENELYKRNQKFYYYYIDPARGCPGAVETPRRLVIRFNAMGLAKELLVE